MYRKSFLRIVFLLSIPFLVAGAGAAEPLLEARVQHGVGRTVESTLSRADLDALPQDAFETSTIWTTGIVAFSGPALSQVVEHLVGPDQTGTAVLRAANGYLTEILLEEIRGDYPIVATLRDGAPFGLRDKGPLWVVFPYDRDEAFQSETSLARSVWQLVEIDIFVR